MSETVEKRNDMFTTRLAVAPLKLLVMPNIKPLGDEIDRYLVSFRKKKWRKSASFPAWASVPY